MGLSLGLGLGPPPATQAGCRVAPAPFHCVSIPADPLSTLQGELNEKQMGEGVRAVRPVPKAPPLTPPLGLSLWEGRAQT